MGDFGEAERRILGFMSEGTEFVFEGKEYAVVLSGKPTCRKGEPKTDIYIFHVSLLLLPAQYFLPSIIMV